jgi:hypothetical protein
VAKNFKCAADKAMSDATRDLAIQAHAHLIEQANSQLHSRRKEFVDALSFREENGTWIIALESSALWIEEGIPPNTDMLDGLLASPKAKMSKEGSKYVVVPFEHKQGPKSQTPEQTSLTDAIKSELKSRKIPYGRLEMGADGRPKTGLLHSFDITNKPLKTADAPGQGHGGVGDVRQGPTGIPFLQNVRVYQNSTTDNKGASKVQKSIVTFRVASSKHRGEQRWVHPGLKPVKLLDDAYEWALKELDGKIKDRVLITLTKDL